MLTVKMMSGEDIPDCDTQKGFRLLQVKEGSLIEFNRVTAEEANSDLKEGAPRLTIIDMDGGREIWYPQGNSYVLMDDGKVISSFDFAQIPYEEAVC